MKLLHDLFADKHIETVDIEISEHVLKLWKTLQESVITNGLWIQFNKIFNEDPNYSYWSTYIELVKIMLHFIRAHMIGDRTLHLQTFAKMLTWSSTCDHFSYIKWAPVYYAECSWSISIICGRQFCCLEN